LRTLSLKKRVSDLVTSAVEDSNFMVRSSALETLTKLGALTIDIEVRKYTADILDPRNGISSTRSEAESKLKVLGALTEELRVRKRILDLMGELEKIEYDGINNNSYKAERILEELKRLCPQGSDYVRLAEEKAKHLKWLEDWNSGDEGGSGGAEGIVPLEDSTSSERDAYKEIVREVFEKYGLVGGVEGSVVDGISHRHLPESQQGQFNDKSDIDDYVLGPEYIDPARTERENWRARAAANEIRERTGRNVHIKTHSPESLSGIVHEKLTSPGIDPSRIGL